MRIGGKEVIKCDHCYREIRQQVGPGGRPEVFEVIYPWGERYADVCFGCAYRFFQQGWHKEEKRRTA